MFLPKKKREQTMEIKTSVPIPASGFFSRIVEKATKARLDIAKSFIAIASTQPGRDGYGSGRY